MWSANRYVFRNNWILLPKIQWKASRGFIVFFSLLANLKWMIHVLEKKNNDFFLMT